MLNHLFELGLLSKNQLGFSDQNFVSNPWEYLKTLVVDNLRTSVSAHLCLRPFKRG